MKKAILFTLFCTALVLITNAQVKLGAHVNAIAAGGKMESQDMKFQLKTLLSWKAGLAADIPLTEKLSFLPQLNLLAKGGKVNDSYNESYEGVDYVIRTKGKIQLTYLELPLNLGYKKNNFVLAAGPSLSYGLGGKARSSIITSTGGEVVQTIDENGDVLFDGKQNSYNDVHLKALELGANVLVSYQFANGIFVQANYNLGLSNIDPDQGSKWKNRYVGVGLGYFFWKK